MKSKFASSLFIAGALLAPVAAYAADSSSTSSKKEAAKEFVEDSVITSKIKAEFAKDKTVSALKIHVDTDKGVVKLSGNAKSKEESARAAAIAQSTKGVTTVANNIQVGAGPTTKDATVRTEISTSAGRDPAVTVQTTTSGKASGGVTKDASAKKESAREFVEDAVITSKIKGEYAKDKEVSALKINVDTDKGVVRLSGNAKTKSEADKAVSIAEKTKGVASVRSNIQIGSVTGTDTALTVESKGSGPRPTVSSKTESAKEVVEDAVITSKIKAEYAKDKAVSALKIHVDTDKGVVKLSGNAKSKDEADKAVSIAQGVKGVSSVKSDIQVAASGSKKN